MQSERKAVCGGFDIHAVLSKREYEVTTSLARQITR